VKIRFLIMTVVASAVGLVACATKSPQAPGPEASSALGSNRGAAADADCKAVTTTDGCDAGTCALLEIDTNPNTNNIHFNPTCLKVQQGQGLLVRNKTGDNRCVALPAIFDGVSVGCVQVDGGTTWQAVVNGNAVPSDFALSAAKGSCPTSGGCPVSFDDTINGSLDVTSKGGGQDEPGR
jgi:hypothetical protein